MRILLINAVCGTGSTGKICGAIAQEYEKQGHTAKIAYGRDDVVPEQFQKYAVHIGSDLDVKLHGVYTRLTDRHGFGSKAATKRFLLWAEEYDPDVLWLHNIHGYYINIELLFKWIKSRPNMEVKWTLHDCWAFTGHCSHFSFAGCDKWKSGCHNCPQKGEYPATLLDNSKWNYNKKKELFVGIPNMMVIVPSRWLADLVKESFLKEYPVEVRYNTINTEIFKPTTSDFRERYDMQGKKIILGVASTWTDRKGLPDFVKLAGMLDDSYRIVLVGLTADQAKQMPTNIIAIPRTNSQQELAQIYTAADVHLVPSKEETFGMTILEADRCGTRSVVLKGTACEEVALLVHGVAVADDVEEMVKAVMQFVSEN